MQKYNIWKLKHGFQVDRYCKLQNIQKSIIGCWKCDFDNILWTNCKNNSLIWVYWRAGWVTRSQPPQLARVGRLWSNCTRLHGLCELMTWSTNLAIVQFAPAPRPKVTVRNHRKHHPEETGKWRNYNSQLAKEIHIWHPDWSIFNEITYKILQTGNSRLWNFRISPRHVEFATSC